MREPAQVSTSILKSINRSVDTQVVYFHGSSMTSTNNQAALYHGSLLGAFLFYFLRENTYNKANAGISVTRLMWYHMLNIMYIKIAEVRG